MEIVGRTMSGGHRLCADRSRSVEARLMKQEVHWLQTMGSSPVEKKRCKSTSFFIGDVAFCLLFDMMKEGKQRKGSE